MRQDYYTTKTPINWDGRLNTSLFLRRQVAQLAPASASATTATRPATSHSALGTGTAVFCPLSDPSTTLSGTVIAHTRIHAGWALRVEAWSLLGLSEPRPAVALAKRGTVIPPVFSTVSNILQEISLVFPPVTHILPPVTEILKTIAGTALMSSIPPILCSVANVFSSVTTIFAAIPHILNAILDLWRFGTLHIRTDPWPTGLTGRVLPIGSWFTKCPWRITVLGW